MKKEDLALQPYIERLGGCIVYFDNQVKIGRFKNKLVLKKNWITRLYFKLDEDCQLSIDSNIPKRIVGPSIATLVSALVHIVFRFGFKYDWAEDIANNVYNAYYSDYRFDKEIESFRKNNDRRYWPTRSICNFFFWFFAVMFFATVFLRIIGAIVNKRSPFENIDSAMAEWFLIVGGATILFWLLRSLKQKV